MSQDTNVENLIINKLTRAQYESIANPDPTQLYFITDEVISSTDVTNALGYTPYNSSNPNGYTSNVGTVTSVNNIQPDANGNVVISTHNVGEVITSTLPLTDAGLHLLDGSLLQYGIYQEFIDYIADLYTENPSANYFCTENEWQKSVTKYGSCGKFVYDSTNNTVRLPKVSDILQGTTDVSALGDLVEAGLPNIIGSFTTDTSITANGCCYTVGGSGSGFANDAYGTWLVIDASRSSSIYGNSTTVQPQTIKVLYYIVIATSTKTDVQVDIDEIATDLNGKADTDLTNVTDTGNIQMAKASMPSNTYVDLTLGASGTLYTAPANGYFTFGKGGASTATDHQFNGLYLYHNGADIGGINQSCVSNGSIPILILPVKKGNIVRISYTTTGPLHYFRFIYAEGEV